VIGEGVRDTELADYQRAARTLLVHPLVTATHPNGAALALVRRFARPLAADLAAVAGYRLSSTPTCARLVRRIDRLDDTSTSAAATASRSTGAATPTCAWCSRRSAGPAPRWRSPSWPTRCVDAPPRSTGSASTRTSTGTGSRSSTSSATCSTSARCTRWRVGVDWVRDPDAGEALYDVDRDVLHLVRAAPGRAARRSAARSAGTAAVSRDTRREATRQRLARLLLEHPVVYLDDLDDAERAPTSPPGGKPDRGPAPADRGPARAARRGARADRRDRGVQRPALPRRWHRRPGRAAARRRDGRRGPPRRGGRPDRAPGGRARRRAGRPARRRPTARARDGPPRRRRAGPDVAGGRRATGRPAGHAQARVTATERRPATGSAVHRRVAGDEVERADREPRPRVRRGPARRPRRARRRRGRGADRLRPGPPRPGRGRRPSGPRRPRPRRGASPRSRPGQPSTPTSSEGP
jgi:hypothetical protein